MDLTAQQVREMARLIGLDVPDADLETIALKLSSLFTEMAVIERELGPVMDKTEPVPPVYPHEPAD